MTNGESESALSSTQGNALGRYNLARLVIVGSFLTVFLLVVAQYGSDATRGTAEKAFNIILPLLARGRLDGTHQLSHRGVLALSVRNANETALTCAKGI